MGAVDTVKADPGKTEEFPAIELDKECHFQMKSVVVSGLSRVTTTCSACGGDVEDYIGVHSTSLIRKTLDKCPFCGATNLDYVADERA